MTLSATATLTFLFTDLEGSTRLWERFPEAMKDALRRHDAILRDAIETAGGAVVKTTGDGLMAVFDRPGAALDASLAAQRGLAVEAWGETGPLRARIGIHAGEADTRGGDFFGPTVNRAARIMAAGHGGQVLLSGPVVDLLGGAGPAGAGAAGAGLLDLGRHRLKDLGEHRLKDLGRPEHLFQLVHPDLAQDFPSLRGARPGGTSLPARAARLIGRHAELAQLSARLADPGVRLLTLIGPGGTGKTALAVRVAEEAAGRFAGDVAFVDLSGARDGHAVLLAIGRAVGLVDVLDRPLAADLAAWLADRRMLLVLDSLEQVSGAGGAVADLLRACPDLTILATSREALRIRAEHRFPIEPLSLPPAPGRRTTVAQVSDSEAVQLFVDRARSVVPDFALTDENAAAVAEICRRLDGLPLAIELAAARLRRFSADVLRDRLDDRLGLLRSGPRDLPERQQTLRATMDWSYDLLDPGQQRLFAFLAVFAEADPAAIEAVAAGVPPVRDLDVLDGLADLVDKSLVRQVDVPGGEPRVAMLETIREFAADRLGDAPDFEAAARRAHATWYADLARRLRGDLLGPGRERAMDAMVADLGNLRLAWRHWVDAGDAGQLDKLADALLIVNDARSRYQDTVDLAGDMLRVLAAGKDGPKGMAAAAGAEAGNPPGEPPGEPAGEPAGDPTDRVGQEIGLRITLARALMATRGFTQEAEDALTGALELFERGGNVRQQFSVLRGLASLYQFTAQFEPAGRLGQQILDLGVQAGDRRMQVDGHLLVGVTLAFGNQLQAGLDHLDAAIALFEADPGPASTNRVANDPRVACLTTAGFTVWQMGRPDLAVERMDAALRLADRLEHPITTAYASFHAGLLRVWRREPALALDLAARVADVADRHELAIWAAVGRCLQGAAQAGLGDAAVGLANVRAGLEQYQGRRSPPIFWPMLRFLEAGAALLAGRPAEGLAALEPALQMMQAGPGTSVLPEFQLLQGDLLAAAALPGPAAPAPASAAPGSASAAPGPSTPAAEGRPEDWYRQALDRAAAIGCWTSHLRAATRLARLEATAGRHDAARQLLAPVVASYPEAATTAADLLDAQAILASTALQQG